MYTHGATFTACSIAAALFFVTQTGCQGSLNSPAAVGSSKSSSTQDTADALPDEGQVTAEAVLDADRPDLWTREGEDWPGFLGRNRDGKSAETKLNWNWPDGHLPLLWTLPLSGGYGSGSAARGRYYHFDRVADSARLRCLNAETGKLLWTFEYPTDYEDLYGFDNGPRCSPIIDEDRVYIFGVEGKLFCLDALNGNKIWMVDTAKQFGVVQNFFGVGSSPLVFRDLLIVMVGGSPDSSESSTQRIDQARPNGSAIVAFDKRTGEVRYQTIDDLASYASPIIVPIQGKPMGLAFCRGGLSAFDPLQGNVFWSFPWRARKYESVNASTPVAFDESVLITESYGPGGAVLRISDSEPVTVWTDDNPRNQSLACHWCTPVVVGGFAYASSGEYYGTAELRCVDLATGAVRWGRPGLGRCNLIYADGKLVCQSDAGTLFVIDADPNRFTEVARFVPQDTQTRFTPPCYAGPILTHGMLIVRDAKQVKCFELRQASDK